MNSESWFAHNFCGDLYQYEYLPGDDFATVWVTPHDEQHTTYFYHETVPFDFEHQFEKWAHEMPHYTEKD